LFINSLLEIPCKRGRELAGNFLGADSEFSRPEQGIFRSETGKSSPFRRGRNSDFGVLECPNWVAGNIAQNNLPGPAGRRDIQPRGDHMGILDNRIGQY
jgi:hypothetical protein